MNIQITNEEIDLLKKCGGRGKAAERLYRYIKQFKGAKDVVCPKLTYLADQLGLNEKTIRRSLSKLESVGLIEVNKKWKLNHYSMGNMQPSSTPAPKVKEVVHETKVSTNTKELDELKAEIERLKKEKEKVAVSSEEMERYKSAVSRLTTENKNLKDLIEGKENRISTSEREAKDLLTRYKNICKYLSHGGIFGEDPNLYNDMSKLEIDFTKFCGIEPKKNKLGAVSVFGDDLDKIFGF